MSNEILVATWNWFPSSQVGLDVEQRIHNLRYAVEKIRRTANSMVASDNLGSVGLVRAILVVPEYFFTAPYAYRSPTGRSLGSHDFFNIQAQLCAISAANPRVLIVPGTIVWTDVVDVQQMRRQAEVYLRICERAMNISGKNAVHGIVEEVCRKLKIDDAGVFHHVDEGWWFGLRALDEPTVLRWWRSDPYMWAYALDAVVTRMSTPRNECYGRIRNFGAEIRKVQMFPGSLAWGMRNTTVVLLNGRAIFRYDKRSNHQETLNSPPHTMFMRGESPGVGAIEGMKIGFEICKDHAVDSLPQLIRNDARNGLDLHIVVSDYVRNRIGQDHLLVEGGYKIHASTKSEVNGVWRKKNGNLVAKTAIDRLNFLGRTLSFWLIDIDKDVALADTFMSEEGQAALLESKASASRLPSGESLVKRKRTS